MRKWIPPALATLAAAGVVAAIVIGHGHSPSSTAHGSPRMRGSASAFLGSVVRLLIENRYSEAWTTLNPVHQRVAPRSVYVACEELSPIKAHLVSLRVLAVGHDLVRLTPRGRPVESVAVTFGLILSHGESKVPTVLHLHAVARGGRWTWILPPTRYSLYKSGGCGPPQPQA